MARELRSSVVGAAVDAYDRHVGRYGPTLAAEMVRVSRIRPGQRALDVGCGTGALALALAQMLGGENVAGIDPSERFVAACHDRIPAADFRVGVAEELPWPDATFDVVLSQLVVDGLTDPGLGLREMRRVARPGGVLCACVWDFAGGMPLLRAVWDGALQVDAGLARSFGAEERNPNSDPEQLGRLWQTTGLADVECGRLQASARYDDFDDLWYPFANGVGNLGRFHEALDEERRASFKRAAAVRLGSPKGPFELSAAAWYVRGVAVAVST